MQSHQRMYRHILRTVTACAACAVFISSLSTAPVQEKTYESTALLASAVGVFAGALPNPDNTKAAALAAKEAELVAREAALGDPASPGSSAYDLLSLVALAVSSLVLLLVVLNFYFDRINTLEQHRGPFKHS